MTFLEHVTYRKAVQMVITMRYFVHEYPMKLFIIACDIHANL